MGTVGFCQYEEKSVFYMKPVRYVHILCLMLRGIFWELTPGLVIKDKRLIKGSSAAYFP